MKRKPHSFSEFGFYHPYALLRTKEYVNKKKIKVI